jgi:hypothetical protein
MTRARLGSRTLWRVNAIVVLMAGLLVSAAAVLVIVAMLREISREPLARESARREPEVAKGDVFELGAMTRLRGTPVMLIELRSRQRYSSGSYTSEPASVRNLLFYDSETGKSSWLFTQYGLLTGVRPLAERGDDKARIRWIMLESIAQDTNRDGRLTAHDAHALGVVDSDGQNYKELLENVERVLGVEFLSDTTVDVAFTAVDTDYIAEVDLPRREVRKRTLLRYHQRH